MPLNMNRFFKAMKKFLLVLMLMLTVLVSCGTTNYVSRRTVNEMDEISYVLANYYPQLYNYYAEGVMDVYSMKEVVLEDGTVDYKIKYRFIRYYYRNYTDKIEALKLHFPEIYEMYISGVVDVNSIYKYVDKNTGIIRHHVSYNRIYDYYYHYYPRYNGTHIYYYRPRVQPPPPRRPRIEPKPEPRPQPGNRPPETRPNDRPRDNGNNPGRQPNVNQNNPPRTGGGTVNRGSQPSRSTGSSNGSRSSGTTNNGGRRGR